MSDEPILRPEEVAGVLGGDASQGAAPIESAADGPQPYSLREPVAIPPSAEADARQTLERIVAAFAEVFRSEAKGGIELTLDGMQQQRTSAALSVLPPPAWVVSLARSDGGGVALALNPAVGLALVDLALGGTGSSPEAVREPTPLEGRVLSRLIGAAAKRLEEIVGEPLRPRRLEVGKLPGVVAAAGETVGVGLLRLKICETDYTSLMLVTASLLLPARRKTIAQPRPPGPMARRLRAVPVEVRPVLRAGRVGIRDLMTLGSGKVLRLDSPANARFELRVFGTTVEHGSIVREDDRSVFTVDGAVDAADGKEG